MSRNTLSALIVNCCGLLVLACITPVSVLADETFVSIHKVSGNSIHIQRDSSDGARGRGVRSPGMANEGKADSISGTQLLNSPVMSGPGQRRRGTASTPSLLMVAVPNHVKITAAMQERRTFEFRALGELPGGLRNSVFQNLQQPLKARIVTKDGRITEINVITETTDINQTATSAVGETIIAVRPKRPPTKQRP